MKHTELMIGNYVSFDDFPVRVTKVGLTHIEGLLNKYDTLYEMRLKIEHINPIPITEELLLKNGFERYDKHSFHLRVKPYYTLYLVKPKDSQPWFCKVYGCGADDNYSINALYLHQYQNLCNIAGVEMKWKV